MRIDGRPVIVALVLLLASAARVTAQAPGVGEVSFPNSGAPAAQQDFLTGLAQLHNFEFGPAAALFRKAQQADPDFAMAYWGEAMTYNHAVWMEQDLAAGRAVLQRLAPTPAARMAKTTSDREKAYLRAVETLYGDGDKNTRDFAYAEAMADIHRRYPDDVEASALTALAVLGTAHAGRDFAVYMRAASLLEPLFTTHPKHPGVAHYLIHSYDDPVHAPLGLRAARAYSSIAPSAAHAQHMCSHIFVAMGMWDEVVEANEAAVKISQGIAAPNRPPAPCGHYPSWLLYGYLQQGRIDAARKMVTDCHQATTAAGGNAWIAFSTVRARYLLDTGEWAGDIAAIAVPAAHPAATFTYEFTNAFAAALKGDVASARAALSRLDAARQAIEGPASKATDTAHAGMPGMAAPPPDSADASMRGRMKIMRDEIDAMIKLKDGAGPDALGMLRTAAAEEERLPFEFGPPFIDKPSYELLGETLLALNQPQEARVAFEKALARTPERTAALTGLMKAAAASGDAKKEADVRARLQAIWHRADRKGTERR